MNSFSDFERDCQAAFLSRGKAYHAYTSGKEMPILFTTPQEQAFVMNVIAYAAFRFNGLIKIIAFTVMDNHLHFLIIGEKECIDNFFNCLNKKLKRTIPEAGRMKPSFKPIKDMNGMRNNIVYINRNGFVANPGYTPFSYPWGTGRYYFNAMECNGSYGEIPFELKRSMLRGRVEKFPSDWQVMGTGTTKSTVAAGTTDTGTIAHIAPPSFCDIRLGMAMFRDAHHYFAAVSKNVEAYSDLALELDDGEFLTDQELFSRLLQIVRGQYHVASIRELTKTQRFDLARTLHYDYRSSNGQIRRILDLTQYEVDSLFPLGKKSHEQPVRGV